VVLGVRPEHFSVRGRARARTMGAVSARVEVVEPEGSETMAVLRLGEREVTARFDPEDAPRAGETVELMVDMDKASLFDPVTERRIG
jgi:multiple sugar transport system ATP-binding protein